MNIFDVAANLQSNGRAKKSIARKKSPKKEVIVRRSGEIVKNITRVEKKSKPVVKKDPLYVRKAEDRDWNDCWDWPNYKARRKCLGKYIYTLREELAHTLRETYSVDESEYMWLSLADMRYLYSKVKGTESKSLEVRDNSAVDQKVKDGDVLGSIKIVAAPVTQRNVERYEIDYGVNPVTDEKEQMMADIHISWRNFVDEGRAHIMVGDEEILTDPLYRDTLKAFRLYCKEEIGPDVTRQAIKEWASNRSNWEDYEG